MRTPAQPWPAIFDGLIDAVQSSPCPMYVAWGAELYSFGNDAAARLTGIAWGSNVGRPARELWGGAWAAIGGALQAVHGSRETASVELALGDGREPVLATCSPAGEDGVLCVFTPVIPHVDAGVRETPGRGADEAWSEAAARFDAVFHQQLYLCFIAPDGTVTDINRAWLAASGFEADAIKGHRWWELPWWNGSEVQAWTKIGFAEAEQGGKFRGETPFLTADGGECRVELDLTAIRDARGALRFVLAAGLDVTDRHRSVQELKLAEMARETEARFRRMADAAPVLIWMSDRENRRTWFNQQWLDFVARPMDHEVAAGWYTGVHADDVERTQRACRDALARRVPFRIEFRMRRSDGDFRWMLDHGVPLFGHNGELAGYIGSCIDITERKQAELAIQRLAAIVESSADAILAVDLDGYVTSWNRGAELLYGYTAVEIVGQPISLLIPTDRRSEDAGFMHRIVRGESVEYIETRRLRRDGSVVDVAVSMSPIRNEAGEVIGVSRIARDITERRRTEAELRRREQLYRAIGESIDYGVWVADASGRMLYVSDSFSRLVGGRVDDYTGAGWAALLHPDDASATLETWRACLRQGSQWEREHRILGVDGRWHPVLTRGVPVRDERGAITSWVGINLDILRLKQNEEALRESEERFRTLADNIAQFAWTADSTGRIVWFNRRWFEYTGLEPERDSTTAWEVVHPEHVQRVQARFSACVLDGKVWEDTFPLRRHDGEYRWFLSRAVPIRGSDGSVVRWFGTNTDVTDLREIEQKLERARDEAVAASRTKDDFLAALSHELRTPLNPVLLVASDASERTDLPEDVRQDFAAIRKHVSLEARLIDDLLDLTRISRGILSLHFGEHDVHAIIRDALATVAGDMTDKSIELTLEFRAEGSRVRADPVRLQQALWNILKNAVKFTPSRGRITLATRATDAATIEIAVTDTGIGISRDELARIFDAFSQGDHALSGALHRFGGLGLGLTISRQVVEMHGGRIVASSGGVGQGATFVISLPLVTGTEGRGPDVAETRTSVRTAPYSGLRVLLVEDHASTRIALKRLLVRRGFEVIAADTVAEARAVIEEMPFDLLISDVGLPDGSGCDLMRACADLRAVPGVAITGYGMDHDIARSRDSGFSAHLTKPINIQDLDRAIGEALAGEPPESDDA